ncbi:MAG: hypothetical protein HY725_17040 [Candidatus Rokubacteria bacterium]|nr:hypothetical protein [Candidatus Rokubacteria bacterium]
MTDGADRSYLIEHWVRSNLRSHDGKPFDFEVAGAKIKILPPAAKDETDGFIAQTLVRSDALLVAERAAHDALTALLDVLCYEMRVSGLIVRTVKSQVEEFRSTRRCVVYVYESRSRSLFLMGSQAKEIRRILAEPTDTAVARALYWLRWTYNARTVPEAFLFAWMAVERLAGEQEVVARCAKCQKPVKCEEHGEHHYSTVPRSAVSALLKKHNVAGMKPLLGLRNPLVHGSLEHNFMQRVEMKLHLPDLVRAVEEELRARLNAADALSVSPLSGPGDAIIHTHCEYRTAFPDQPFPPDCPTSAEVEEYKETVRRGQQHPKIINLLAWPPDW